MTARPPWFDEVLAVYAWADEQVRLHAPICTISGRCCRFRDYGHNLFLSQLEASVLFLGAPFQVNHSQQFDDAGCPYQINGRCEARESRPLACRIYFCDPAFQDAMPAIIEEGIRKLKQIADTHGTGWSYSPLHHFLDNRYPAHETIPLLREPTPCDDSTSRRHLPLL
jgi:hypothetical protein